MNDIVYEWYVPYVPGRKQMLLKAVAVSAAIVFLIDAVFFAAVMLIPAAIFAAAGFFLARSLRYEYEYVYVNGDLTVSKIIRKEKRKDVFQTGRVDIRGLTAGRKEIPGKTVRDFTSNRPGVLVYTVEAKGMFLYMELSNEFLAEMKRYYPVRGGISNG